MKYLILTIFMLAEGCTCSPFRDKTDDEQLYCARQAQVSAIMLQGVGQGLMQSGQSRQTHCSTQFIGNQAYTDCN